MDESPVRPFTSGGEALWSAFSFKLEPEAPVRNENSIMWDGRLDCPKAGRMSALPKLDVI